MRLLFLGDIVGKPGRVAVLEHLPGLRKAWQLDCVIIKKEVLQLLHTFLRDFLRLNLNETIASRKLVVRSTDNFYCFERDNLDLVDDLIHENSHHHLNLLPFLRMTMKPNFLYHLQILHSPLSLTLSHIRRHCFLLNIEYAYCLVYTDLSCSFFYNKLQPLI